MSPSEKISISHIGLPERDLTFIRNLFKLGAHQLGNFQFMEELKKTTKLILINGDSPLHLNQWKRIKERHKSMAGIVISATGVEIDSAITLARPLVLKKFVAALQEANKRMPSFTENAIHILVVDDSYPIRHYLNLKLPELFDYSITIDTAESGEEALMKIENKRYDVVFLDVVMPGLDGYQVCRQIKSKLNSHVIMLTSNKSPFDRIKGSMSGCDSYITKPPTEDRLREVITKFSNQIKKVG